MNAKRLLTKGVLTILVGSAAFVNSIAQTSVRQIPDRAKADGKTAAWSSRLDCEIQAVANIADGDNTPFWFSSNRQGIVQDNLAGGYGRTTLKGHLDHTSGLFVNYGIDGIGGTGYQSDMYLQQLYANLGFRCIDLSIGKMERWGELADPDLSSGSLTWSGNSRPIPQVRFEMPEFTRLPVLDYWFSIKGHVAYGKYEDSDWIRRFVDKANVPMYTENTLYHSKAAFLKAGDLSRFPIELIIGLEMYAQFGGTGYNLKFQDRPGHSVDPVYEFPHDRSTYMNILLPFNKAGQQDRLNGNSLGSWHLALNSDINDWQIMLRYEHFYEDHSSMLGIESKRNNQGEKVLKFYGFQNNWFDGLFALEVKAPREMWFKKAVFEFLNTYSQCGPVSVQQNLSTMPNVDGRDNMYQHYVYQSYSYFGSYMGTPLLISPLYSSDGSLYPKSTRAMAFHMGIEGNITNQIGYRYKLTRSSHWGTYDTPLKNVDKIWSQLLEISYTRLEELKFIMSVGIDRDLERNKDNGSWLLGNQSGIMLTVSKRWSLL